MNLHYFCPNCVLFKKCFLKQQTLHCMFVFFFFFLVSVFCTCEIILRSEFDGKTFYKHI